MLPHGPVDILESVNIEAILRNNCLRDQLDPAPGMYYLGGLPEQAAPSAPSPVDLIARLARAPFTSWCGFGPLIQSCVYDHFIDA
jgi:hypothetical protein